MWPFKKKKSIVKKSSELQCTYCGSTNIFFVSNEDDESLDRVKVWRNQRYVTCKCRSCNRIFYKAESDKSLINDQYVKNVLVDDEDLLNSAEEELKRQADHDGDHRF
jgi:hypothetical protein